MPTLVLIHGWCGDRTIWRMQDAAFAAPMKLLVPDLPGHGAGSQDRDAADLSIAALARHVVSVVKDAAQGPLLLVGHSMGGPVALEAAVTLGSRCRLVIGVDTFTDPLFYARRQPQEIRDRLSAFDHDFEGEMAAMVKRIIAPDVSPALAAEITAAMAATPKGNALAALRSLLDHDIESRWPFLRAPALTINSARLTRPDASLELPGLDVRMMEGVGHFPMLEAPDAFNAFLCKVMAQPYPSRRDVTPPPPPAGRR